MVMMVLWSICWWVCSVQLRHWTSTGRATTRLRPVPRISAFTCVNWHQRSQSRPSRDTRSESSLLCRYRFRVCVLCFPQQKLRFPADQISWVSEWVIEFAIFLHGLAQQWKDKRNKKIWQKGSLGDEDDARTVNTQLVQRRKRAIPHLTILWFFAFRLRC